MLTAAGFEVVPEEMKSSWNPEEDDFARVPVLVHSLLGITGSEAGDAAEEKQETEAAPSLPRWQCPCGYIYDPTKGNPTNGVKPGTAWEDVPADWTCPVCGLPKAAFKKID